MCEWEFECLLLLCLKVDNHLCNIFGTLYVSKKTHKRSQYVYEC